MANTFFPIARILTWSKDEQSGACTVTITPSSDESVVLRYITFSYASAPTGGALSVESPSGTELLDVDVTASGAGSLAPEAAFPKGQAVVVKLASGGAIATKLSVGYFKTKNA